MKKYTQIKKSIKEAGQEIGENSNQQDTELASNIFIVQVEVHSRLPSFGSFKLQQRIAKGGQSWVYSAFRLREDGQYKKSDLLIIKIFKNQAEFVQEKEVYDMLLQQNSQKGNYLLYKLDEIQEQQILMPFQAPQGPYNALVLPYCETTLHDLIWSQSCPIPLDKIKIIFRQILQAVGFLYIKGYSHNDLKLENILFDSQFNIRVADFGRSLPNAETLATPTAGTKGYQSYQVYKQQPFTGHKNDVHSMGVILFNMVYRQAPFQNDYDKDIKFKNFHYKQFYPQQNSNGNNQFWSFFQKPESYDPNELNMVNQIIENMLAFYENQRFSLADLAKHPWISSP